LGWRTPSPADQQQRQTHERLPKVFNIESDPREGHNIGAQAQFEWVIGPVLKAVDEYKASLRRYPNPPAANITRF
jgi:hypothetical protein